MTAISRAFRGVEMEPLCKQKPEMTHGPIEPFDFALVWRTQILYSF